MTRITIEATRVVHKGEKKWRIKRVNALNHTKLPDKYLYHRDIKPVVYLSKNINTELLTVELPNNLSYVVRPEDLLTIGAYDALLRHCQEAGEHLREVNQQIRTETLGWEDGNTTITVQI